MSMTAFPRRNRRRDGRIRTTTSAVLVVRSVIVFVDTDHMQRLVFELL